MTIRKRTNIKDLLSKIDCLTRKTVYADVKAGKYPARRIGRDWVIDENAAIEFYNSQLDAPPRSNQINGKTYDEFYKECFGGENEQKKKTRRANG